MTHREVEIIYNVSILLWVLPFYIYGLIKWVSFRRHFLISKRFPCVSNAIIGITLISSISHIYLMWIAHGHEISSKDSIGLQFLASIGSANAFFIASLAVYRLLLVHLRWRRFQSVVTQIMETNSCEHSQSDSVDHDESVTCKRNTVYQDPSSILFIIYVFIGYTVNLFRKIIDLPQPLIIFIWMTWVMMVIALIIFIKYKKVTEGIGCLRETYITLFYVMIAFIFNMCSRFASPVGYELFRYFVITLLPFPGLLSIYMALYYIRKFEGGLDATKWNKKCQTSPDLILTSSSSEIKIVVRESRDNIDDIVAETAQNNQITADLELSCFAFLRKQENYKAFTVYLAHCFALENMLFFERACILYQIVNKYKKSEIERKLSEDTNTKNNQQRAIIRAKFTFLNHQYFEYTNKINKLNMKYNKMESKDIESIDYYKKALYKVYQSIFREFIEIGSKNEINVSCEAREQLQYLFSGDNMDKFESFSDFLYVFDNAMIEICQLLLSVYNFRFKKWFIQNQ